MSHKKDARLIWVKSGMCIPFEPSSFSLVSQLWDPEVGVDYVFSWSRQLLSCITENRIEQRDEWKDDVLGKVSNGPQREKTCLWGVVNNTGADQPAH